MKKLRESLINFPIKYINYPVFSNIDSYVTEERIELLQEKNFLQFNITIVNEYVILIKENNV